jgi:hypothetical protein
MSGVITTRGIAETSVWDLPRRIRLRPVLEWCLEQHRVDRLLVSARIDQPRKRKLLTPEVGGAIDEIFGGHILARRYCSAWPGTELIGHRGLVVVIAFSAALVDAMSSSGRYLFDWRHHFSPSLPEDLCLYRQGDPLPVLVSVTHENDAWILSGQEVSIKGAKLSEWSVQDLLIPGADHEFVGGCDR